MEMVKLLSSEIISSKILDNEKVGMNTILEKYNNGLEFIKHEIILPDVTDSELIRRYNKINPIVQEEEEYYFLKRYNLSALRNQSYLWNQSTDKRALVDLTGAKVIDEFSCYHTCGYYGIFRPSIAEVLCQFPDDALEEANAFFMYESPETAEDLHKQWDIVEAHCQRSRVRALSLRK
jgi:hypothetical protein